MVEVTTAAADVLKKYLAENNFDLDAPMRVMKHAGCGGTRLALAFDDPGPQDKTFKRGDMMFVVDEALLTECGGLTVDFVEKSGNGGGCGCSGGGGKLTISSANPLEQASAPEGGGGGCGCSSGGCS